MKTFNSVIRVTFFLLFILLLVGCKKQESTATEPMPTDAKQETYKPKMHIIEIKDMKFEPEEIQVHVGDTVIWVNKDMVAHDVTQTNKEWASPALASNASWKKAVTKSDSYYCSIHVVMTGKITVEY